MICKEVQQDCTNSQPKKRWCKVSSKPWIHRTQAKLGALNLFLRRRFLVYKQSLSNNKKKPYAFLDSAISIAIGKEVVLGTILSYACLEVKIPDPHI
jgi:hypothetical protein